MSNKVQNRITMSLILGGVGLWILSIGTCGVGCATAAGADFEAGAGLSLLSVVMWIISVGMVAVGCLLKFALWKSAGSNRET